MISQHRKKIALGVIVLLLVVVRMVLPTVIKNSLNDYLKDFSPSMTAHIRDVDLGILRGEYSLEGITGSLKQDKKEFIFIDEVQTSVAWRDLFKGKLAVDVLVSGVDFIYTKDFLAAVKEQQEKMKEEKKKEKPSPVRIARFDLKNATLRTDIFPSLTRAEGTVMTKIEARATNLNPSKENPLTPFSMQGKLLNSGQVKVEGEAELLGDTPKWTIDNEVRGFDLTTLNRFLKKKAPLTFTKGKVDLYAEASSQGGPIRGYVKPFVTGLDVVKSGEVFEGPKHWLIEIITAVGNAVMKADDTAATRVPFVYDKEFKPESGEAISKAFEHGFVQELNRGIENSMGLDTKDTKEDQEKR